MHDMKKLDKLRRTDRKAFLMYCRKQIQPWYSKYNKQEDGTLVRKSEQELMERDVKLETMASD